MRMVSHGTESFENDVWACPERKLSIDGSREFGQGREVSVVELESPQQFPDPFDGIELRAVGRQKVKAKPGLVDAPPLRVQACVMVFRIVGDDDHAPTSRRTNPVQMAEEIPACLGIEMSKGLRTAQFAVTDPNSPEVADGLAGRCMPADGIKNLGRHPHPAAA